MDQNDKVCRQAGHDHLQVQYVCTFISCQTSRLACSDCLLYEIHKHEQKNNNHIINWMMFEERVKQDIKEVRDKQKNYTQYQSIINLIKQKVYNIQTQLKRLLNLIENLDYNSTQFIDEQVSQVLNSSQQEFHKMSDDSLNILLNLKQWSHYKLIQDKLREFNNIIQADSNDIKNLSDYFLNQEQNLSIVHESVYEINDKLIETAVISNDLQYLVQSGKQKMLKVWDLPKNAITNYVKIENRPTVLKFSDDSTMLYSGTSEGYIVQFHSQNQFQQKQSLQIHSNIIIQIVCISTLILLTSSQDNYIIKTNFSLKQQLFKVLAHKNTISSFDYDQVNNYIVSCSLDLSIKLWNGQDGQIIIDKLFDKALIQIQILGQKHMIFGLDLSHRMQIWKIDYEGKNILQHQITDQNGIYNFTLVHDYQFILIICEQYVKVYTIAGQYVRQYNHKLSDLGILSLLLVFYDTKQHPSMKAILIKGEKNLIIYKILDN